MKKKERKKADWKEMKREGEGAEVGKKKRQD